MIQGYSSTKEDLIHFLHENKKMVKSKSKIEPNSAGCTFFAEQTKLKETTKWIVAKESMDMHFLSYNILIQFDANLAKITVANRIYKSNVELRGKWGRSLLDIIKKKPAFYKPISSTDDKFLKATFEIPSFVVIEEEVDIVKCLKNFNLFDTWIEDKIKEVIANDVKNIYEGKVLSDEGIVFKPEQRRYKIKTDYTFFTPFAKR